MSSRSSGFGEFKKAIVDLGSRHSRLRCKTNLRLQTVWTTRQQKGLAPVTLAIEEGKDGPRGGQLVYGLGQSRTAVGVKVNSMY